MAVAVLAGFVIWAAVGSSGLFLLRTVSSAYALAEPTKSYTLPMLLARLTVALVCTVSAGAVAAVCANGSRVASAWLGAVLVLLSAPIHSPILLSSEMPTYVRNVWVDYPPWYHMTYLLSLLPLTLLGRALVTRRRRE